MLVTLHTPVKRPEKSTEPDSQKPPVETEKAGPSRQADEHAQTSNVRRSVGEWELVKNKRSTSLQPKTPTPPRKTATIAPPRSKPVTLPSQEGKLTGRRLQTAPVSPPKVGKFPSRTSEARACLSKAKTNLELSRNLKTDIKASVIQAIDRMYELVKESEAANSLNRTMTLTNEPRESPREKEREPDKYFQRQIEEHSKLLKENNERMESLKEAMDRQKEILEKTSYANVAAGPPRRQPCQQAALHSVVVSSKDGKETGEEVLGRIREAVNAKEGGIKIDRVRKAKDGKVIVGCRTEEQRQKIKDRLRKVENQLNVEEIQNKDPLLILRDVLQIHSDEDVIKALRSQNDDIFKGMEKRDDRVEIRYRKKARNPHLCHIVVKVSPKIWNLMVEAGEAHVDLQRVKVMDQSPLVQCSLCLGYGHGRRHCQESVAKCSHCGGPHMRTECVDWLAGEAPSCCNCRHAKFEITEHNAFSQECPVRRRWDALARASVAYC